MAGSYSDVSEDRRQLPGNKQAFLGKCVNKIAYVSVLANNAVRAHRLICMLSAHLEQAGIGVIGC